MNFRHTVSEGAMMLMNSKSYLLKQGGTFLLLVAMAACGGSSNQIASQPPPTAPTVMSSNPPNGSSGMALNGSVSVTFSEAMDSTTLNASTFTLTSGSSTVPILGTVIYADSTAVFWPAAHLMSDTTFTATITTGAKNTFGVALPTSHVWSVTTGHDMMPGLPVNLGTAGNFAILAKSGISTIPISAITGNIGVSPAAATYITGFSLIADSSNVFSTSTQVVGKVYASNFAVPTPANMTKAVGDMQLAFTDAAGRAPDVTELGAGNIGGMTLAPGVYKWGTGLLIPTNVTLSGSATDVWIFQIAQNLTVANGAALFLAGGAQPKNVFWQVSGAVDIGTTAHYEGTILSQTAIALRTGASINGKLLAQTAVTLDGSTVNNSGTSTSTMPMIISTTPLNGATGVPLDASISATFSEAMKQSTLTTSTFTLASSSGAVPGTVAYSNSTAVFTPTAPLANNKLYTATITTGAKSALNVALAANHSWNFTTVAVVPIVPAVLSTTPLNGTLNVPVNSAVSAAFSVAMDPATLSTNTFTLASSAGAVPGTVAYSNSVAVFTPTTPLLNNKLYTATVTTGAKSALNVALAANHAWAFTTGAAAGTMPTVRSTTPLNGAQAVPVTGIISASFSEMMDQATLTTNTFTLTSSAGAVLGSVAYANSTAIFTPTAPLLNNKLYTATITTGAKSAFGVALASNYRWSFTTAAATSTLLPVNLGTAGNFVILAKTGISSVPNSAVTGNLGISPAAASFITGFSLTADASNVFSTSTQVVGKVYAANYAPPTPSNLTTAVGDMQLAFTDAAGRAAGTTELGAGNIGGLTLTPGVYKWSSAVLIPSDITLNGSATDVWIFQIAQNLTLSNATHVYLTGGAVAKNVFWQVSGLVDVGTTAHMEGIVLSQTAIHMKTGSSANSRLLAQTAVTLDTATVVQPAP